MEYQIFKRVFDLLPYQLERYPQKKALEDKYGAYSTEESIKIINQLSSFWIREGITKSDKIVFISENGSPQWVFFDMSIMQLGAITVPIHAYYHDVEFEFIFEQIKPRFFIVQNQSIYNHVKKHLDPQKVISIDSVKGIVHWKSLLNDIPQKSVNYINSVNKTIGSTDVATIMYTSGATGMPKGVVLSHQNLISNIKSVMALMPIRSKHQTVSYLPISHVFERMIVYLYISVGAQVFFIHEKKSLFQVIKSVRPHYMTAVPRILEKLHDILRYRALEEQLVKKKLILWAMKTGKIDADSFFMIPIVKIKHFLAYLFVYRHWRLALGGRLKSIGVGAAALDPSIGKLFSKAGVKLREGYGLTETSPVITFNRFTPGGLQWGTVGTAIPGVQIKIDKENENGEGEILVKGPNVMIGYYKSKSLTLQSFDSNGWFRTGDIGKILDRGFLKITDRKKNIFKTSSGKYIAPQKLEQLVRKNELVDQCMIIGFQKPYLTIIIVPEFVYLKKWCEKQNIHWTSASFMHINPMVKQMYQHIIDRYNEHQKKHEKIKNFVLLTDPWSIITGEYTPSLKLRRNDILKKHDKVIQEMYT